MVNRSDFNLPPIDSGLILDNVAAASGVQKLSTRIDLDGTGSIVHMFSSEDAEYTPEGGVKPVVDTNARSLTVSAEKFAKIEVISKELKADAPALAQAIYEKAPQSFASIFDKLVIGDKPKPSGNFDSLATAPEMEIATLADAYAALSAVEAKGVTPEAWLFSTAMINYLSGMVNTLGLPVFDLAGETFLGLPFARVTSTNRFALVGPWKSRTVYGVVEGDTEVRISEEASLEKDGTTINLWQRNLYGILAETRFGFRAADVNEFVKLVPAVDAE